MPISIDQIESKRCKIGVVGLGNVGLPLSLHFVDAQMNVIGFDTDKSKVDTLNSTDTPFKSLYQEHLRKVRETKKFSATCDLSRIAECDAVMICAPIQKNDEQEPGLEYVKEVCVSIAPHLKPHTLVSLESGCSLQTAENVIKPLIEKYSTVELGKDLYLSYSRNGKVGGANEASLHLAHALYSTAMEEVEQIHRPQLIDKIRTKQCQVGIIGLGYVGLPLSMVFAEADVNVIGFDIDESKVNSINEGKSYFKHLNGEALKAAREKKKISATNDFAKVAECDAILICVPTPLDHHLEPDLRFIVETCESIAPHLKPETLVILESTTWPGTTEEVVKPILESKGNVALGEDLYLAFSPEREDPGNKTYGTKNIPKLVGGANEQSLELATALYSLAIDKVVSLSSTRVAECSKLFENIFRSVNIALVNEMKVICEQMDIDVWEVIRAAGTKPFGFMPFQPGPGLGGHCIPIDPFYLTWKAKEYGISTRFIELAGEINRSMPNYVVNKVQDCLNTYGKALKGSRILMLGLAYKPDIDDMRESPSLKLIHLLEEKGAKVDFHDPFFSEIAKTREYSDLAGRKHQPLSPDYDCFLLATQHTCFDREEILSQGVPIIDTRNYFPKHHRVFRA